jgi:trehalose 6-phosphate phosphatase
LAPIVADRHQARPAASTKRLLACLCALAPCAVISGRSLPDLSERLDGIPVAHLVGSHGASLAAKPGPARRAAALARALRRELGAVDGVDVEETGLTLAVHYRAASRPRLARRHIERAVTALGSTMRIVPGKMVVNLVPRGVPHKGDALRVLLRRAGVERALYLGDDETDEDVFALPAEDVDLVGARVGRSSRSAARWYVPCQRDVDEILRRLLHALRRSRPLGGARRSPTSVQRG